MTRIEIGTAGWSIPRQHAHCFPTDGTALQRYAARLPVAEINSSFHRPHRPATWERWRDSVPPGFRFSVKLPKQITHRQKLVDCSEALDLFIEQVAILREKLAVLLVQLPPRQMFDAKLASIFFADLSARSCAYVACEPRHPSWFTPQADALLEEMMVARVAADPAICPEASSPGGWRHFSYWRLHGSPVIYRSSYQDRIGIFSELLKSDAARGRPVWCILDNTASSAGAGDALELIKATAIQ